jgi:hypothetical protein
MNNSNIQRKINEWLRFGVLLSAPARLPNRRLLSMKLARPRSRHIESAAIAEESNGLIMTKSALAETATVVKAAFSIVDQYAMRIYILNPCMCSAECYILIKYFSVNWSFLLHDTKSIVFYINSWSDRDI